MAFLMEAEEYSSAKLTWHPEALLAFLKESLAMLRERQGCSSEKSSWWPFLHTAVRELPEKIRLFMAGKYQFSPMLKYPTPGEMVLVWQHLDRLFIRALLYILKPLFPHLISPQVFHLQGPSGVQSALSYVRKGLDKHRFRYFFRIDIKSYYASINHDILLAQIETAFKDIRVKQYLKSIVTIAHLQDGAIEVPTQGIPRRSSLSPLFGALYLAPLDKHFSKTPGILYARYMDDMIVLTKTKRQYVRAKKAIKQILTALKLQVSRKKTKMGLLTKGFHFLGVEFQYSGASAPQSGSETQIQPCQTQVLHARSCKRALTRVQLMNENSVHPEHLQSYLVRWVSWWSRTASLFRSHCLTRWVEVASLKDPPLVWLGTGLTRL